MSAREAATPVETRHGNMSKLVEWISVAILIYILLVAVSVIGTGFNTAAGNRARSLFEFAANPFAGLIIGTLATALIQSSTTVTSIIVGLVAGGVPVSTEAAHKARKDWGFPFFSLDGWHISATNSYAVGQVHLTSPGRSGIGTAFKSSLRDGIASPGDQPISYYAASSRPVLFCSISPLCPLN